MITIRKSSGADTRTAKHKVTEAELLANSLSHIKDVKNSMNWMASQIKIIARNHDWTKVKNIHEFYQDFQSMQGSFQGDFKQMHWYKDLHLQERHHLNDRCPENVNLFDVLERVADIVTAGLARSGSIYDDDISSEILQKAYKNTIELLKSQIKVEEVTHETV